MMRVSLAIAVLLAFASPAHAQPATSPAPPPGEGSAAGRCGVCHPAERVQFETSAHAREQVRCVSCHGGDDRTLTQGVAHGSGFRGRPGQSASRDGQLLGHGVGTIAPPHVRAPGFRPGSARRGPREPDPAP